MVAVRVVALKPGRMLRSTETLPPKVTPLAVRVAPVTETFR